MWQCESRGIYCVVQSSASQPLYPSSPHISASASMNSVQSPMSQVSPRHCYRFHCDIYLCELSCESVVLHVNQTKFL